MPRRSLQSRSVFESLPGHESEERVAVVEDVHPARLWPACRADRLPVWRSPLATSVSNRSTPVERSGNGIAGRRVDRREALPVRLKSSVANHCIRGGPAASTIPRRRNGEAEEPADLGTDHLVWDAVRGVRAVCFATALDRYILGSPRPQCRPGGRTRRSCTRLSGILPVPDRVEGLLTRISPERNFGSRASRRAARVRDSWMN